MIHDLINDLRHDKRTRSHFDMGTYLSECGTHGCIAGHVAMRTGGNFFGQCDHEVTAIAESTLGFNPVVTDHLFHPCSWVSALVLDDFTISHRKFWTPNTQASEEIIADMKAFAVHYNNLDMRGEPPIYARIGPDQAANALQGLLDCPGYVNWQKAIEAA